MKGEGGVRSNGMLRRSGRVATKSAVLLAGEDDVCLCHEQQ